MTLHARYLIGLHLRAMLVLSCGLISVLFLFRFADVAQRLGGPDGVGATTLLWQAVVRTPMELQNALPHLVIVSAAVALHGAASRFEIAVMVQIGLSGWRLVAPLMISGAIVGVFYTAAVSPLVSAAHQAAEGGFVTAAGSRRVVTAEGGGKTLLFADRVTPDGKRLEGLHVIRLDARNRLDARFTAAKAQWTATGWGLTGVQVLRPAADGAEPGLSVAPELLAHRTRNHLATPLSALPAAIAHAAAIGAPSQGYRLQLQGLLALPVLLAMLSALAGAVVLHPLPRGRWGAAALSVLAVTATYYTGSTVANAMALRSVISPAVAAWGPPMLCVAALIIWRLHWKW